MGPGQKYSHGGYSVFIASNGAIQVSAGDQVSHYSMAKYHNFDDMDTRFGRMKSGKVQTFKALGADPGLITVGETIYDIATHNGGGQKKPGDKKAKALDLIEQFERRAIKPVFIHFKTKDIADQLRDRVADPSLIEQHRAGICGPAALVFNIATDDPETYVRMVTSLFETGRAKVGKLNIDPSHTLFVYKPVSTVIVGADWIPTASLRNSEDYFSLYPLMHRWTGAFEPAGPSTPWAIKQWFSKVGYEDAHWGLMGELGASNLINEFHALNLLFKQNYRIVLLINHQLEWLNPTNFGRLLPTHYVGLTSRVTFSPNPNDDPANPIDYNQYVTMRIFSNGLEYDVGAYSKKIKKRSTPLTVDDVHNYIWAYAAGRY